MSTLMKKKPEKVPPPKAKKKKPAAKRENQEKFSLKHLLMGEEKPDLTELGSGSTTILGILSPTAVGTKSRDCIVVGGVYHAISSGLYLKDVINRQGEGFCAVATSLQSGSTIRSDACWTTTRR